MVNENAAGYNPSAMATRKPGRPITIDGVQTIGVRVGKAMAHDLDYLSKEWECSVSDVVRAILGHEIDLLGKSLPKLQSTRRRRAADVGKGRPNGNGHAGNSDRGAGNSDGNGHEG
jgi:hypothetical protein